MANGQLQPAAVDHVTSTVGGYVIGGVVTAVALAVAAPVLAPVAAAATIIGVTAPLTVLGGGLGAWIGYNRANNKALTHGIRAH